MPRENELPENVLDSIFNTDRERGGNSAPPEQKDPISSPEVKDPPIESKTVNPPADEVDDTKDEGRTVPLRELTTTRKKLRGEVETERSARLLVEGERNALKERLAALESRPQAPQRQQPQRRQQIPDPVTDPEGYAQYNERVIERRLTDERLNRSEDRAIDKHGQELVEKAYKAAGEAGLLQRGAFLQERHPYDAMVQWFNREQTIAKVGPDPVAYETKIREEERAKLLEELKKNGLALPAAAAAPQRFPGTLADRTKASGEHGDHLTTKGVMSDAFSADRPSRGRARARAS